MHIINVLLTSDVDITGMSYPLFRSVSTLSTTIKGENAPLKKKKRNWNWFFSYSPFLNLLSEPDATSEESPSADEEQAAASSAAPAEGEEGEPAGETEPTENGEKADEGAAAEKGGDGTEKKEWVSPES